tara:strand:- start:243 stop:452 length:210 start_codon:yes stop_codon:yes gene_type:complete
MLPTGADIRVSRVPSLLSSAKDRIVRKGIRPGEPKTSPTTKEERGGRIQSVVVKLSMKNLNPIASNERK